MEPFVWMLLLTALAGAAIPLGALLGLTAFIRPQWLEQEFRHAVIALGGGILLAAVALVLVPEGSHYLPHPLGATLALIGGGLVFFLLERLLGHRRRESPQLLATLLDYLPESLALGGAFAAGAESAPFLALMIALQNLPEGFNTFRELRFQVGFPASKVLVMMSLMVPLGPLMGMAGWLYFSEQEAWLGGTMLFAAGGILYLIFQDIAPQSRMRKHWAPPLGAVLGFGIGLLGHAFLV